MLPGDCIQGRFLLDAVIGEGGMGTIFRALDLDTDTLVAVKVVPAGPKASEGAERFRRESTLLAELRHPHVVRWLAHGFAEGEHPFLVMEWLDGEDLASRLSRGPLAIRDAVRLAIHVADALSAVHAVGIIHRDIKPENIYLQHRAVDEVRVLDFGIARSDQFAALTRKGVAIGTAGFMAPEQLAATGDVGPWTDVFALGCVLYESLTGRLPFTGPDPLAALFKSMVEDAPRVSVALPTVPPALDQLVAHMLERDTSRRIRSATDALSALRAIEATLG